MVEKRKAPKGCYWRGDTLWGRFEVQGIEFRRSLRTDEAKVAAGRLKDLREKQIAAVKFGEVRPTWEDAVVAWGQTIGGHTKPTTQKRYMSSLTQLEPFLAGLFVDEIDAKLVTDIVRRRRGTEVTNATIRRDLVALSSVMAVCEDEGWRTDNPALSKMRRLKERRDPIVLPEPSHIERVIARSPVNFAALIRAAWLTGCRQDELRRLERSHLDFVRGQISVYKGKGSKLRVIDMLKARPLLEKLPVKMHSKVAFWHSDGEPYLNISSNFRRLVASSLKDATEEVAKAAGKGKSAQKPARQIDPDFRPFRFHDLRHRFAVDYLKNGGSIYDLQQHLGHTSVKTTEVYLAYLTADEASAAKQGSAQKAAHEQRFDKSAKDLTA